MVLPKSMRIKGHRCFDHLYKEGIRYHTQSMLLRVAEAKPQLSNKPYEEQLSNGVKCAVAISSKVQKKAVIRNRIRRLLHKHLVKRLSNSNINSLNWVLFSLKPYSGNKDSDFLLSECDKLLHKAGLIK